MQVKCTCVPAGARNSTVFQTSVLFARSLCGPGGISQVKVWPYSSCAMRFPSSEKITCRCWTSCTDDSGCHQRYVHQRYEHGLRPPHGREAALQRGGLSAVGLRVDDVLDHCC